MPQGVVVVSETPEDLTSTPDVDESEIGARQYFVLADCPALSGDQIENPEPGADPTTNQPNVNFDFTDEGQAAFQEVTREISLRGQENYFAATGQPGVIDFIAPAFWPFSAGSPV